MPGEVPSGPHLRRVGLNSSCDCGEIRKTIRGAGPSASGEGCQRPAVPGARPLRCHRHHASPPPPPASIRLPGQAAASPGKCCRGCPGSGLAGPVVESQDKPLSALVSTSQRGR